MRSLSSGLCRTTRQGRSERACCGPSMGGDLEGELPPLMPPRPFRFTLGVGSLLCTRCGKRRRRISSRKPDTIWGKMQSDPPGRQVHRHSERTFRSKPTWSGASCYWTWPSGVWVDGTSLYPRAVWESVWAQLTLCRACAGVPMGKPRRRTIHGALEMMRTI